MKGLKSSEEQGNQHHLKIPSVYFWRVLSPHKIKRLKSDNPGTDTTIVD
jgi:hypothetical protein